MRLIWLYALLVQGRKLQTSFFVPIISFWTTLKFALVPGPERDTGTYLGKTSLCADPFQ